MLRESPPVYVVHDFATEAECNAMMELTIPQMTPSVVSGGGTSKARPLRTPHPPRTSTTHTTHATHTTHDMHTMSMHTMCPCTPRPPRTSQARQSLCTTLPSSHPMPEQARQSFSTNMMPDWSDELDTVTRAPSPSPTPSLTPSPSPSPTPTPTSTLTFYPTLEQITRIARRKFAFAREVGDYTSLTLTLNPNPNP